MLKDNSLVIRYSALFDDTSKEPKDIERVSELVCSLLSLKLFLFPYLDCHLVIYTLDCYKPRLQEILNYLEINNFSFIFLDSKEDIAVAESIKNCTHVDRIVIRRMLADFRELPSSTFRLLMGADCYFFQPPQEIISYTWNKNPPHKILYMIDNFTFRGIPYKLRFYRPEILKGLLGDFYCLAPGVSLNRESIIRCLKLIDDWPLEDRWIPSLPRNMKNLVHACEQQAVAMLLGQFPGKALSSSLYNHWMPRSSCVLLHSHFPWQIISLQEMPQELALLVKKCWKDLGYQKIIEAAENVEINRTVLLKRRVKQLLWRVTDKLPGSSFINFIVD